MMIGVVVHSFTTHQHANGHTQHKTFTPRTHHTRYIQMLADVSCVAHTALTDTDQSRHTPGQPRV